MRTEVSTLRANVTSLDSLGIPPPLDRSVVQRAFKTRCHPLEFEIEVGSVKESGQVNQIGLKKRLKESWTDLVTNLRSFNHETQLFSGLKFYKTTFRVTC
jgi:hypothetical protein